MNLSHVAALCGSCGDKSNISRTGRMPMSVEGGSLCESAITSSGKC
nr:MAG TPA: hypothetical protein [Caudoviricetes sp.]